MHRRELTNLILALLHYRWPTPPLPSPGPYLCTTTTTAFGHATPSCVREVPSPSPDRLAYRPMEPSDTRLSIGSSRPPVQCPRLGTLPPTGLHRGLGPLHRVIRRRRREKKKKTKPTTSRWSPTPLEHRRYARRQGSPSVHGADPKDRWCHGPPPRRQPHQHCPLPCLRHRHFLQAKPTVQTSVHHRI
jgi:hypothetical protein